jgi:hypothetical protein
MLGFPLWAQMIEDIGEIGRCLAAAREPARLPGYRFGCAGFCARPGSLAIRHIA